MGLCWLMVSYLTQSLCKCRRKTNFTAVCWKTQGFSNHVPGLLIQLPLRRPTLWLVPDLLRVQSIWHFPWDFPIAAGALWLQEMTENCDCNNANGPMPGHSCLFNHTKYSSGLITRHWKRSLIQSFGLWQSTVCTLLKENGKLNVWHRIK